MSLLYKHTCYLCGPIDNAIDGGRGWRESIKPRLKELGLLIFDPTNKKIASLSENEENLQKRRELKIAGNYEELRRLGIPIRHADLRAVDLASFLIVYLDFSVIMMGTLNELFIADQQRKPILCVVPQFDLIPDWLRWTLPEEFLFQNFDDMFKYLADVDAGNVDNQRWVLYNYKDLVHDS